LQLPEKNTSEHITEKKNIWSIKEDKCKKRFIETVVVHKETHPEWIKQIKIAW